MHWFWSVIWFNEFRTIFAPFHLFNSNQINSNFPATHTRHRANIPASQPILYMYRHVMVVLLAKIYILIVIYFRIKGERESKMNRDKATSQAQNNANKWRLSDSKHEIVAFNILHLAFIGIILCVLSMNFSPTTLHPNCEWSAQGARKTAWVNYDSIPNGFVHFFLCDDLEYV